MEAMLAGKPRSVAIGALRALVVPLRENWGDIPGFARDCIDILAREGGGVLYDEENNAANMEQLYRSVVRARATYFRSIENPAQLEVLFKELDVTASSQRSPMQQGVLWLASRLQLQAIQVLQAGGTDAKINTVLNAVGEQRAALTRSLGDPERLTLDGVESALAFLAQTALGGKLSPFDQTALAGHLLEVVRAAARRPPKLDVDDTAPRNDAYTALFAVLIDPVKRAELNEARLRYARLNDDEKNRRFNEFRRNLGRVIAEVAPFAPQGLESFCFAIETKLFPYPEPLQFIRSYARPIWTNASQSNVFANATTPQGVQHIYDQLSKNRQGNPVVLELARAFALHNFRGGASDGKGVALNEVDLKAEFGWPSTLAELKSAM